MTDYPTVLLAHHVRQLQRCAAACEPIIGEHAFKLPVEDAVRMAIGRLREQVTKLEAVVAATKRQE